MKKLLLTILVIVALVITHAIAFALRQGFENSHNKAIVSAANTQTETLNADTIFSLVNQERIKAGVPPLKRDARLDATAQARADDMVARKYFSHYDPKTGENLVNILHKYQPDPCIKAGENIGMTNGYQNDNIEQLDWWMHSKPHHDAILNPQFDLTGVAVSGNKVVQHFCGLK